MNIRLVSVISLLSIVLVGCGVPKGKGADIPKLPTSNPEEIKSHATPLPAGPKQWDDMPKDPPLSIPRFPGLDVMIERAIADLAQRLSIPESQIETIETKEVAWPDASLGCPKPGIVYAQIPTPGYLVVLEVTGDEYEYHVDIHGNVLYCENPTPPISGTPGDVYPFRTAIP